jgi:hypothetical protein
VGAGGSAMRGTEKAVLGGMFAVICGLVGVVWATMADDIEAATTGAAAARERLAIVETKTDAQDERLERIEQKLDLLLLRVPPR